MNDAGREGLIHGIEADALRESGQITADAEKAAEARRGAAGIQAASILEEARCRAREQASSIRRAVAAATAAEARRIGLRVREEAVRRVLERVQQELRGLVDRPDYRRVLLGWIVEAAVGLGRPEAEVSASAEDLRWIDDDLLREAQERAGSLTGCPVRLERAAGPPPAAQGVLLTATDGRVAFNNQVPTRLQRYQSEIRRIIHEELFS